MTPEAQRLNMTIYVRSEGTNIMETWRRWGFVPPSELPHYQAKWSEYQSLHLRQQGANDA
jgi:hypothetical protein